MSQQFVGEAGQRLTTTDLDQILATTFVSRIEFRERLPSTNDLAVELAVAAEAALPLLVITNRQTAGRGRGENSWWAEAGSLAFSLVWRPAVDDVPQRLWPQVSLHVALGVGWAIEQLLGPQTAQLKWPNDVYLLDRKVCGILVELPASAPGTFIVGVGLNVNNCLSEAPAQLAHQAIALCQVADRPLQLAQVLAFVLEGIAEQLDTLATEPAALRSTWHERCLLTGRQVRLDLGTRQIYGLCQGIAADGALLVDTQAGTERCYGGVVEYFEA